jgi:hypothetical protein
MTCETCTYYFADVENTVTRVRSGDCRRFPPQIVQTLDVSEIVQEYAHPCVRHDHWCGEYFEVNEEWKSQKPN